MNARSQKHNHKNNRKRFGSWPAFVQRNATGSSLGGMVPRPRCLMSVVAAPTTKRKMKKLIGDDINIRYQRCGPTVELTGRGDYIQPSIQSIKLRSTLPALRSNDLLDRATRVRVSVCTERISAPCGRSREYRVEQVRGLTRNYCRQPH